MKTSDHDPTIVYSDITWAGEGFSEPPAQKLWGRLPDALREIAAREIAFGNIALSILENRKRNIVLLSFAAGPLTELPDTESTIRIHRTHSYGNYCYDGTRVTYEEVESGSFLAFEDPNYEEEAF